MKLSNFDLRATFLNKIYLKFVKTMSTFISRSHVVLYFWKNFILWLQHIFIYKFNLKLPSSMSLCFNPKIVTKIRSNVWLPFRLSATDILLRCFRWGIGAPRSRRGSPRCSRAPRQTTESTDNLKSETKSMVSKIFIFGHLKTFLSGPNLT